MTMRPRTLVAAACIVVVGFAIGAWLAIRTRGPVAQTQRITAASSTVTAPPVRTLAPRPVRTPAAAATPPRAATPTPVPPPVRTTPAGADAALEGSWQIDEDNVRVGMIRWVGDAEPASGTMLVFNVHKQSVGGRAAVPCEQQTVLHAAFARGVAEQAVPYREVNCDGIVSTGEVHVTSFSGNGASFRGSFWRNGVNLGNFNARRL
jgi:hypothetical protein